MLNIFLRLRIKLNLTCYGLTDSVSMYIKKINNRITIKKGSNDLGM
jgi:hypothetical protein